MNVRMMRKLIWLILLGTLATGLTACGGSTPTPEPTDVAAVPSATDTAAPPSPTPVPPSPTPVPPTPTAIATLTPEVGLASASSENCIGCHTNEETLQALAEDKTVKSEATEGEG
jgi:multidrug efflux pump subunit AcrA (membrane-fusion protein)